MYANLRVTLTTGEQIAAWKIHPAEDRSAQLDVYTDEQDGTGSYAEPGPVRTVALVELERIAADF